MDWRFDMLHRAETDLNSGMARTWIEVKTSRQPFELRPDDGADITQRASIRLIDAFLLGGRIGLVWLGDSRGGEGLPIVEMVRDFAALSSGRMCLHAFRMEAEAARKNCKHPGANERSSHIWC